LICPLLNVSFGWKHGPMRAECFRNGRVRSEVRGQGLAQHIAPQAIENQHNGPAHAHLLAQHGAGP
jgi:hypothetical protein